MGWKSLCGVILWAPLCGDNSRKKRREKLSKKLAGYHISARGTGEQMNDRPFPSSAIISETTHTQCSQLKGLDIVEILWTFAEISVKAENINLPGYIKEQDKYLVFVFVYFVKAISKRMHMKYIFMFLTNLNLLSCDCPLVQMRTFAYWFKWKFSSFSSPSTSVLNISCQNFSHIKITWNPDVLQNPLYYHDSLGEEKFWVDEKFLLVGRMRAVLQGGNYGGWGRERWSSRNF